MRQHIRLPAWSSVMAQEKGVLHCIPTSYQQQQLLYTQGVGRMSRRKDVFPGHRALLHFQQLSHLHYCAFLNRLEHETSPRTSMKLPSWRQHLHYLPWPMLKPGIRPFTSMSWSMDPKFSTKSSKTKPPDQSICWTLSTRGGKKSPGASSARS